MKTFFTVLLFSASLQAQTLPRYDIARAPGTITIDGKLDEPAWTGAAAVTLQFLWESQTGAKQMTHARLLWDGQALYVGYDAEDADINAIQAESRNGVLKVRVPKQPATRARTVEVQVN